MSDLVVKKASAAFGTLAFTILAFGSWILGARPLAALFRGAEGFVVFGLLAWCVLKLLQFKWDEWMGADLVEEEPKGQNLDETA